jgi:hypothetical protein
LKKKYYRTDMALPSHLIDPVAAELNLRNANGADTKGNVMASEATGCDETEMK